MKFKELEHADRNLVGIAIGEDSEGTWFVQTTDLGTDSHLSECIQEGLECKAFAHAIAMLYVFKYNLKFFDWSEENGSEEQKS